MADLIQMSSQVSHLMTCPVCFEEYSNQIIPKMLPCQHHVCRECLSLLLVKEAQVQVACPQCRVCYEVPGNDVDTFPTSLLIRQLIDNKMVPAPPVPSCSGCSVSVEEISDCDICEVSLCGDCLLKDQSRHALLEKIATLREQRLAFEESQLVVELLEETSVVQLKIKDDAERLIQCVNKRKDLLNEIVQHVLESKLMQLDIVKDVFNDHLGVIETRLTTSLKEINEASLNHMEHICSNMSEMFADAKSKTNLAYISNAQYAACAITKSGTLTSDLTRVMDDIKYAEGVISKDATNSTQTNPLSVENQASGRVEQLATVPPSIPPKSFRPPLPPKKPSAKGHRAFDGMTSAGTNSGVAVTSSSGNATTSGATTRTEQNHNTHTTETATVRKMTPPPRNQILRVKRNQIAPRRVSHEILAGAPSVRQSLRQSVMLRTLIRDLERELEEAISECASVEC